MLEQVALGAGTQRLHDPGLIAERRQHEHPHARVVGDDALGCLDAVHLGHRQIHQHDVRLQLGHEVERLQPVGGHADQLDVVGGGQQLLEAIAHDDVVVDHRKPDHSVAARLDGQVDLHTGSRAGGRQHRKLAAGIGDQAGERTQADVAVAGACARSVRRVKPRPSSSTTIRATLPLTLAPSRTRVAPEWLTTLRSASCALRYMSPTVSGESSAFAEIDVELHARAAVGDAAEQVAESELETLPRAGWAGRSRPAATAAT